MAANLDLTHGLILAEAVAMALGEKLGKAQAHALVEEASAQAVSARRPLGDVLAADARVAARLSARDLERLLEPRNYLGLAKQLIERALAARGGESDGAANR